MAIVDIPLKISTTYSPTRPTVQLQGRPQMSWTSHAKHPQFLALTCFNVLTHLFFLRYGWTDEPTNQRGNPQCQRCVVGNQHINKLLDQDCNQSPNQQILLVTNTV